MRDKRQLRQRVQLLHSPHSDVPVKAAAGAALRPHQGAECTAITGFMTVFFVLFLAA